MGIPRRVGRTGSSVGAAALSLSGLRVAASSGSTSAVAAFYGQVANRCFIPNDFVSTGTYMSKTTAYLYGAVNGIYIAYPNFKVTTGGAVGETSSGLGTLTGKIGVDANGTNTPCTFNGGAPTGSVAAGGILWSYCPLVTTGPTWIFLRAQLSSTGQLPAIPGPEPTKSNLLLGECLESTATDKTASGTIVDNVYASMMPCAIVARTTLLSMALIGDSITKGTGNDIFDAHGNSGTVSQALGQRYAHLNLGVGGELTSSWTSTKAAQRIALSRYGTHQFFALGKNDIRTDNAATLEANTNAAVALAGAGYPIRHVTMQPCTDSATGHWAATDHSDQVISTTFQNSVRQTENARRRATSNVFDTSYQENGTDYWIANGTAYTYTVDGVHPRTACDLLGVTAMASYTLDQGTMLWMPQTAPTLS